jgi:hypothetical protein
MNPMYKIPNVKKDTHKHEMTQQMDEGRWMGVISKRMMEELTNKCIREVVYIEWKLGGRERIDDKNVWQW